MPPRYTGTGLPKRRYQKKGMNRFKPGRKRAIGKIRRFLPLAGFPEKKFVKLRYVETKSFDISTFTPFAFSCNSAYDPNQSGAGHSPYGFNQWALIYNHYKVWGSKMTLRVTNAGALQCGTIYGIKVDDDGSVNTNVNSLMEQKDSRYDVIVGQNAPRALSKKWSLRKTMDPTEDGVSAIVSANPSDQEYFVIYAGQADPTVTAVGRITFQVQIDYLVQFSEIKDFANS